MEDNIEPVNKKTLKIKIKIPSHYNVIFTNDTFTPFRFVQLILEKIFNKNEEEAITLTNQINQDGQAVVGTYTKEIAITKQKLTEINSKKNNYPLLCTIKQV